MTLVLCSISQDCIPLLGFKTRFSPELILCNQLLVSKVLFAMLQPLDLKDKKLASIQGASKVSYILGYNGKYIRLKASCKLFLKRGVLL